MIPALHGIAAFLLALVGYSLGSVLVAEYPDEHPSGWEVLLATVVGIVAAGGGPMLVDGWLVLPSALAGGVAAGSTAALAARSARMRGGGPGADPLAAERAEADEAGPLRRLLDRLGTYQGRITMALLYFALLAPFAFANRLTSDGPGPDGESVPHWLKRTDERAFSSDDDLRRQG